MNIWWRNNEQIDIIKINIKVEYKNSEILSKSRKAKQCKQCQK